MPACMAFMERSQGAGRRRASCGQEASGSTSSFRKSQAWAVASVIWECFLGWVAIGKESDPPGKAGDTGVSSVPWLTGSGKFSWGWGQRTLTKAWSLMRNVGCVCCSSLFILGSVGQGWRRGAGGHLIQCLALGEGTETKGNGSLSGAAGDSWGPFAPGWGPAGRQHSERRFGTHLNTFHCPQTMKLHRALIPAGSLGTLSLIPVRGTGWSSEGTRAHTSGWCGQDAENLKAESTPLAPDVLEVLER